MKKNYKFEREYKGTVVSSSNYKEILKNEGIAAVRFHQKHLKAYLRGDEKFVKGVNRLTGEKIYYTVEQELTKINLEN